VVTTKPRIAVVKIGERLSGIGEPSIRHDSRHRGPNNLLKIDNITGSNLCKNCKTETKQHSAVFRHRCSGPRCYNVFT
jgi:hypothetical protein